VKTTSEKEALGRRKLEEYIIGLLARTETAEAALLGRRTSTEKGASNEDELAQKQR